MNIIKAFWTKVRRHFSRGLTQLRTVVADDVPDDLLSGDVYLIGENGHFWFVVLLYPCGRGETILLNLVAESDPFWTFELELGTRAITLHPSVWRTAGCRSHFFLRSGRVQWCPAPTSSDALAE